VTVATLLNVAKADQSQPTPATALHDLIEKYAQRIQLLKIYVLSLLGRGQISSKIIHFNLINSKNNSTFICPVPGSIDNHG
jgi:hypothetical protein